MRTVPLTTAFATSLEDGDSYSNEEFIPSVQISSEKGEHRDTAMGENDDSWDHGRFAKCEDAAGNQGGGLELPLVERVRIETGKQLWLAFPMMGVNLVQFAVQLVSVMFVGHLGELDLSGASIATSFCNVTGCSFLLGLASALETLCGQAYGAKQYHLLGIYMQRAMFVLNIIAVPIAVMWFYMEHVLLFFGQAPDISMKAGVYARFLIPELFAWAFLQPLTKFLQTQSTVLAMFLSSCVALLAHTLLCWTLIYKLGLGSKGAALSTSITYWLSVAFLVGVVMVTPRCRDCWAGFSKEAFKDIKQFLKLAVPSAVMVCLEWWSFEALVLLSGVLPKPQLETSVFSIILNMNGLCYMIPYGIGAAASTRISNELGAGRPFAARFSFFVAMGLAVIDAAVVSSVLILSRNKLGMAFSNEKEVVDYVARMVPFLACVEIMDALQATVSGVARGCGWQTAGAIANLGAYYIVGLPIGYILAFVFRLRGKGLLIGILCGITTQAVSLSTIAGLTNWRKQAETAVNRVDRSAIAPLLQ